MIFTRRFGALRARPVFPSVVERDEVLEYFRDLGPLNEMPEYDKTWNDETTDESAA